MQLSSDLEMYHPLWERADNELCSTSELGIFNRLVDVYVLACAIGIKEDKGTQGRIHTKESMMKMEIWSRLLLRPMKSTR